MVKLLSDCVKIFYIAVRSLFKENMKYIEYGS